MEATLGKRISTHRKRMGLTQDALAELLGVTAQAVSKWENDQSCPDISTLPKLADVFGTTTDSLLGIESRQVHTAEVITGEQDEEETQDPHEKRANFEFYGKRGNFEFNWDSGRSGSLWLALWVLLTGGLLLLNEFGLLPGGHNDVSLWDVLWPSGLLVFGIYGLYPKFSVFRLGCALFGGYYILHTLQLLPFALEKSVLLPVFLLLFGASLLIDALKKPNKHSFRLMHSSDHSISECGVEGEAFHCTTSFGQDSHRPQLSRLSQAELNVCFGGLTLDLTACEEIANGCTIEASCSFGELVLLVPSRCQVVTELDKAFGNLDITGAPAANANTVIYADCDVSFGNIAIRYL